MGELFRHSCHVAGDATPYLERCNVSVNTSVISASTISDFPVFGTTGPSLRKSKDGPEYSLVLDYVTSQLPPAPKGQALTVFVEPRIESGFPDAVAVYWDVDTVWNWSEQRIELDKLDVRVLHYLLTMVSTGIDQLRDMFGSNVKRSLARLHSAGLIVDQCETWELTPLNDIFAVRRLVAIEAKMKEWRKGLRQASQNTWFASESYLLVPHIPKDSTLVREATKLEIGVVAQDQSLDYSEAASRPGRIPKSYASWLFNEWVWRAGYAELGLCEQNS